MVNTTSPVGPNDWSESSHSPSSGLVQSGITMVGPFYPGSRSLYPGMRRLLKSSLSLKLSEALESLGWNQYVCNTYNSPFLIGCARELNYAAVLQLEELTSLLRLLMPSLLSTVQEVAHLRQLICRMQATECLLISSTGCFALLLHSEEEYSRAGVREQLSLAV